MPEPTIYERVRELREAINSAETLPPVTVTVAIDDLAAILDALDKEIESSEFYRHRWEERRKEVDKRDCTIAALREGLKEADKFIEFAAYELEPETHPFRQFPSRPEANELRKELAQLLSSPNPGAKVAAVFEAAKVRVREWSDIDPRTMDDYDQALVEAVRDAEDS